MILGWHLVWTCYGWWFPNDPRGSWSREVWEPQLEELGERHVGPRLPRPNPATLSRWLEEAQSRLKHPPVILDGRAALAAAEGIRETVESRSYTMLALAVMMEHVHTVVLRHRDKYERIVNALKGRSSQRVRGHWAAGANPRTKTPRGVARDTAKHAKGTDKQVRDAGERRTRVPVWTEGYWVRYLNSEADVLGAVQYVEGNPREAGLPDQCWSFVERPIG